LEQPPKFPGGGNWNVKPGQITDDSEMAISLMRGIIEGELPIDQYSIAKKYVFWYKSEPVDIGITTRTALEILDQTKKKHMSNALDMIKESNDKSLSNGCLMRITPLAVYCHRLNQDNIEYCTKLDVNLTHSNEICVILVTAYNIAITYLLKHPTSDSRDKGAISAAALYIYSKDNKDIIELWEKILDAKSIKDLINPRKHIGFIKIAFSYAFFLSKVRHIIQKSN
jgi:ADP-ribosyl-[dinitrogen reductase] hydrolase